MPLYEYECEKCAHRFTLLIGVTAEPDDERCPLCNASQIRKLISRASRLRSEDERMAAIEDRLETMGEPDSMSDTRDLMREMGDALDDGMGEEMEEMFEAEAEEESAEPVS